MYTESLKKLLVPEGRWGGEVVLKEGGRYPFPPHKVYSQGQGEVPREFPAGTWKTCALSRSCCGEPGLAPELT